MLNLLFLLNISILFSPGIPQDANEDYILKGKDFIRVHQLDSALIYFTLAIESIDNKDKAYFWRGIAKEDMGNLEGAIEDYTHAISFKQDPKYYNNRGLVLMILNRLNEAISDFKSAILIDPNYSKSWYNLGMANQRQGESEKACENVQHAYDLGLKIAGSYIDANCS